MPFKTYLRPAAMLHNTQINNNSYSDWHYTIVVERTNTKFESIIA